MTYFIKKGAIGMLSGHVVKGIISICGIIYLVYVYIFKYRKEIIGRVKDKYERKKYLILVYSGAILFLGIGGLWAALRNLGLEYSWIYNKYVPATVSSSIAIGILFFAAAGQIYIKDMQKRQNENLIPEIKKQKKNCIKLYLGAIIFGATAILLFIR